jgi:DNA-binding NarL/FixJ family response regulator
VDTVGIMTAGDHDEGDTMADEDAPVRVLVVDDDPLVRAGLTMILGGPRDLEVVAEAPDGAQAVQRVTDGGVDVVLMDLRMPMMDGIQATAAITALTDPPHVLVLTTFDADDLVVRALAAGASGFLLKDTPAPQIVDAVRQVRRGTPTVSPSVVGQLIRQVRGAAPSDRGTDARRRAERLTDRERQVALAVCAGASNAEIATDLHMSVATVKAHISRIFTKLDATNRVQVAICMHDAGEL